MSASLVARVNQRLAQARALLPALAQAEIESSPVGFTALRDACVFHLYCGFYHYLREICQYYGVQPLDAVDSLDAARHLLAQQGKVSAELEELWHLQQQREWLAALIAAYDNCWALPEPPSARGTVRIDVLDLDAPSSPTLPTLGAATLTRAVEQFAAIIERQREATSEY